MKVEIRSDNTALISGYVNVTERDSRPLRDAAGPFIEKVKQKTFQRALESADAVGLMFNHRRSLGSTKDALTLKEDSIGLYAEAVINDPEVLEKARNKELRGWSFGFVCEKDNWGQREDGMRQRTLEEIRLEEVSILDCTPAYIATSIEMRGEEETLKECRLYEEDVETIVDETPEPAPERAADTEQQAQTDTMGMYKKRFETLIL